ncbi:SWI/SNF chromatin-remodeling complex subunit sol1 [Aspergillus udagawae]|uniref:SWI/SNF chromatin-remodeling complex subunit sol1 n=1 Tax=Aspergillus udagawae TaxID=91492 RepID=A0A8E0QQE2_9EURO|nr:uncharacterized protein Aud_003427 [Aspergillus udagawae]GFF37012.1 SWI/SNF chromatin-remodeling complex subunit sol1 [Aspergillus udagawae]GFF49901.1 SWI/SNF chromatin-remodeling complex subunit sol1 [Aspergillus udagawae]GFG09872.1 SWI/SNF chromatin-remodeling complex subunit sol1 [Aspergillus udagawae]GFG23328.1 SWI/SNF chromatin-remodeling complex subunit sol1 [Aspergillus udagawae]GIC87046.1 hypothetical protein Aud_003427 [Aspergillus udagawae]
MNAWLADASNLQSHDNGAFNQATIDPSAAFLHASPTPPDPNQFQRMFNGVPRNASPGFHNPNQVIPSKRSRPEDGLSMSPRQAPGGLSVSRSQTPHQMPFPGYQGPANGAQQFPSHAAPYQHFQQGTPTNVTQSPIMQDFDQHGVQRLGTASPSPFSPAGPHVGPHMSPSQSDHPSRVNTPQNSSFIPGQPFPQGMGPQFAPAPTMTSAAVQAPMQANFSSMPQYQQAMAAQQQRLHALQMQNQGRPMNMNPAMAGRPVAAGMNAMANPQQMAAIRQMQQNMAKPPNPEGFMRSLQKFMMSRNLPLDPNPIVCGRPINLVQLYATVMKLGGSKKVSAANMWPVIAQQLQFPPMQFPMAVQEIREHYQRNLAAYEQAFLSTQQKQFADQMQQSSLPRQPSDPSALQFQSPTVKQGQGFEVPQPVGASPGTMSVANNAQQNIPNGFATPTQVKASNKQPQHRLSVSRQSQPPATPQDSTGQLPNQSPAQSTKPLGATPGKSAKTFEQASDQPLKQPIQDPFKPMVLPESSLHGPIALDEMYQLGEEITRLKPNVPSFAELGVIDIHALTMSVKSGIHAEMRLALDTLVSLSCEPAVQISLDNCEDLIDSLIECAEDQADLLAEHAVEVSDVMLLPSYEEITRGCQAEWTSLADVPEFGSLEYELDRAVDRLICVTTILRNLSFTESNFGLLSTAPVVQFISTIIRYLGTRNMLLRTHQNTLDFMKDAVIYLSNLAHVIQLPSKEEALCLLHFLLSFAPFPPPTLGPDGVMFTSYNASIHKYTPAAVDSLAKLLARDDPNRIFFKAIFSGDGAPGPQHELLTRAFGLAICPVPDQLRKHLAIADARKVFLMQGLLAADILSSFADGTLAKQWLESIDGFAIHLLRLSCLLSTERVPPPNTNSRQSHAARGQAEAEAAAYSSIINRGLTILCRLAEKSKLADNSSARNFPSGIIPKKESLLGALLMPNVDPGVVRQLISYARLAE